MPPDSIIRTASATRQSRFVQLACVLSGAAGLVFEMVWFHRASLVFGSSVWSTSLVLSSFMGGLAGGAALVALYGGRIRSVLRAYAVAECTVATTGVVLTYFLPMLTGTLSGLAAPESSGGWPASSMRFLVAFVILLVPSTAMGATLPLLVTALFRTRHRFGSALGRAYGWNTIGAVVGVLAAEILLIRAVGVAGAAWTAAFLCTGAAALALRTESAGDTAYDAEDDLRALVDANDRVAHRAPANGVGWLLVCAFLAGATLLAMEVVWFRFLTHFVLSTTLAAALMLAVVLAGIAAGGLVASAWLRRTAVNASRPAAVAFAAGASVVLSYAAFGSVTSGIQVGEWPRILWMALVLTLPASVLSGMFFTLLGDALHAHVDSAPRSAGWLTVANTLGGMCGPPVAAFVLLPSFGLELALLAGASVYALAGLAMMLSVTSDSHGTLRAPGLALTGAALLVSLVAFPFGLMQDTYIPRLAAPYLADGSEVVATHEGPSETILITQQKWMGEPVYHRLVTNGFSMSGTSVTAMRYMKYFAYLPLLTHPGPIERVLVVCFGVGVTARAALDLPAVRTVDIAEISPDVVEVSGVIYPNDHPLRDSRVRLHLEDGRQFLRNTSERFDLITGEPPPPRTPGSVNIYTREYFALIYDRLAEGGVATYWLPVGRPDPGTNVSPIMRAFCDVFEDCSLWNATPFDLMLMGSRGGANAGPVSEDHFVHPWTVPALRARLSEVGFELPQQVGATFLGDADYLRMLTADTPPLDDNHPQRLRPRAGHPSLSDPGYGVDPAVTRLYDTVLDPQRAREAFAASPSIRERLPARVVEATLDYFDEQALVNQVLWHGGRPLAQIEHVHRLLTQTPLRTLPMWLLGLDFVKERIARTRDDGSGAVQYARGLAALADRDYIRAAEYLADAERRGLRGETIRPLLVYALCQAREVETARSLAPGVMPAAADERHFWEWMASTFGVGPGS